MNRFKSKKKGKDESAGVRPSMESESSFSLFRRGKKSAEQEVKPEIDLTSALPPSDDFRTSLLMTGLSARFSMLREQDDPNTKIGKASDDSVLFPKRQSRMTEFGFNAGLGLADIAEVESIKPPSFARVDSFASEDSAGNVMNRGKPTDGNNLFGGRQKIYKIAAGASSVKNVSDGGMSGRAVYDHDVAQSSFQRWRLAAKENRPLAEDERDDENGRGISDETRRTEEDSFIIRPESPPPSGYNRKRETSSTTSSTPSVSRTSTAATSIISQPTVSAKDWQSLQAAAPSSASQAPVPERIVMRTRRLYEQGLTQDLHDQQTSVLSRVDTLTRRPGGSRTPDLGANSPSPSIQSFADRFGGERRTILSKASAPNLRSMSPPTTGSSIGTMDLGIRIPSTAESKSTTFLASPPLSPPMSDTGEHSQLPIQAKDYGKATAMRVFQKPVQAYDDSKYAQRQVQLQQGRETPTQRFRDDPNAPLPHVSSTSSTSSTKLQEEPISEASADEPLDSPIFNEHLRLSISPQVTLKRPSDHDHPAFRTSAMPSALALIPHANNEPFARSGTSGGLTVNTKQASTGDSPTLGPNTGLSGMVRQHLRSESDVSSMYGPTSGGPDSGSPLDTRESTTTRKNPWEDQDWNLSNGREDERSPAVKADFSSQRPNEFKPSGSIGDHMENDEEDEFASQLANARQRVREKLTSYVDPDGLSPQLYEDPTREMPPPPSRSNPLGILKGKSSRGSLVDRNRDAPQSKTSKMLGLGSATMTASHSPIDQIFEEDDRVPSATVKGGANSTREPHTADMGGILDAEDRAQLEEEQNAHPGLRAFRNAKRELQRQKELEMLAKHQAQKVGPINPPALEPMSPTARGVGYGRQRTPSVERQPQPVHYQSRTPGEEPRGGMPQARMPPRNDRERSGSEASEGQGQPRGRHPRLRNNSTPYEAQQRQLELRSASGPRMPTMRSPPGRSPPGQPGLPGTDIRRSPHMPPPGYPPNVPSHPSVSMQNYQLDRSNSAGNLRLQPVRSGPESAGMSAGPSPLATEGPSRVMEGPSRVPFHLKDMSGSAPSTPTFSPPRRPSVSTNPQFSTATSTLNESLKRVVNKSDISEPTFLMTTSRVPTMSVNEAQESRSRSSSISKSGGTTDYGVPPPLPPVNPRRKRESSRTRTMFSGILGRKSDEADSAVSVSLPHLPLAVSPAASLSEARSEFSDSDQESKQGRRRVKKISSEARIDLRANNGPPPMIPKRAERNPHAAVGPPANRQIITSNLHKSPAGMQGGMF